VFTAVTAPKVAVGPENSTATAAAIGVAGGSARCRRHAGGRTGVAGDILIRTVCGRLSIATGALIAALETGAISGAALDVTEPEPLPDGHPLWAHERCIITPHIADTRELRAALLARRARVNVARFPLASSFPIPVAATGSRARPPTSPG